MIRSTLPSQDRLDHLLADRAVFGLAPEVETELDSLLTDYAVFDPDAYERAAATIDLALGPAHSEPLPQGIAAKVRRQAAAYVSRRFFLAAKFDG